MNTVIHTSSSTLTRNEIDPLPQSPISEAETSATVSTLSPAPETLVLSPTPESQKDSSTSFGRLSAPKMSLKERLNVYQSPMQMSDREVFGELLGLKDLDNLDKLLHYKHMTNMTIEAFCEHFELKQMTPSKMRRFKVLFSAFERMSQFYISKPLTIGGSKDAYDYIGPYIKYENLEHFYIIMLNRANRIICHKHISKGGVSGTVVDPKVIMQKALVFGASGIILVHNHPSHHMKPSESDITLTKKLKEAGKYLEIMIIDHLIIGGNYYFSFADEGIL